MISGIKPAETAEEVQTDSASQTTAVSLVALQVEMQVVCSDHRLNVNTAT